MTSNVPEETVTNNRVLRVYSGKLYGAIPIRDGLVRFRDGRCYLAAPCWSHFVGLTEQEVLVKCKVHEYAYEWQEVTP